jgi:hypothetical protein
MLPNNFGCLRKVEECFHLCSNILGTLDKGLGLLPKPLVFCEYRLMYILTLNPKPLGDDGCVDHAVVIPLVHV